MIMPSRWSVGGRDLDVFRESMLNSTTLSKIFDFQKGADCFPGIRIGGGVCYFLIDSAKTDSKVMITNLASGVEPITSIRKPLEFGLDFMIRNNMVHSIVSKSLSKQQSSMSNMAWSQKPFGLRTNFNDFDLNGAIKVYNKKNEDGIGYVNENVISKNKDRISEWKLVTSRSTSVPEEDNGQVLRMAQTFICEPGAIVTESYVVVASFLSEKEASNAYKYLKTKFFRSLCQVTIVSPDVSARTFTLVPIQDFTEESDIDWSKSIAEIDAQLYAKYGLTEEEINSIESMIKPM